jgi:cell filamentation protein
MSESEYDYEYEWDARYCYPGSFVLKNKLNIFDKEALMVAEREITAATIIKIKDRPVRGRFDFKHLKDIHRAIFRDIYAWAGTPRTVDIAKGDAFCLSQHIASYAEGLFAQLKSENFLAENTQAEMPERLTHYLSEINVLHPFREGNGRTQRVFIEYLAECAGFDVDFSQVTGKEMIEASVLSFRCKYEMMTEMFQRILSPIAPQEQQAFRKRIGIDERDRERGCDEAR